jgi:stearoyl-CoA desaturase (delta-9 desaturase)
VFGIWRVLTQGAVLYHTASKDTAMIAQYGVGTPDDWAERTIYSKHSRLGILIMLLINLWLFGGIGFVLWGIQMLWIPFWAAGVINGLAHWWGYRNGQTRDRSRNILPFGIIIGGEELHNNHHLNAGSAKLSLKPWEFDIGWMYITLLGYVGLAKLRPK